MMDGGGWASYCNSLKLAALTALFGTRDRVQRRLSGREDAALQQSRGSRAVPGAAAAGGARPGARPRLHLLLQQPANPLNFIYGTMAILVICTISHFYSVSHLTAVTALKQIDQEFETVSASLRVPFWRTFFRVTLPVCLPAVFDIAMYLFVNAMTTVSAVVFLYSPHTTLAAIAVLNMDDAGDVAPAAAMAMLIFATSAVIRAAYMSDHARLPHPLAGLAQALSPIRALSTSRSSAPGSAGSRMPWLPRGAASASSSSTATRRRTAPRSAISASSPSPASSAARAGSAPCARATSGSRSPPTAGIPIEHRGLAMVARRPEARAVLEAFMATEMGGRLRAARRLGDRPRASRCCAATTSLRRSRTARMSCGWRAATAIPALARWLEQRHTASSSSARRAVHAVAPPRIETSRGHDRGGDRDRLPGRRSCDALSRADRRYRVVRCKLHMLRLAASRRLAGG